MTASQQPRLGRNVLAASAVLAASESVADARELMEALGLITAGGHTLEPDDYRVYKLQSFTKGGLSESAPEDPESFTSPAALRVLPPPAPVAGRPKKPKRLGTPRQTAACGSPSGAARHRRHGETPCDLCREAVNAYQRARKAKQVRIPRVLVLPPIDHGTYRGYRAHYRRKDLPVCQSCKDAYNSKRFGTRSKIRAEKERLEAAGVNSQTARNVAEMRTRWGL